MRLAGLRFSIRAVLIVTTYVAVAIQAILHPASGWNAIHFYLWLAILIYCALRNCIHESRVAGAVFAVALTYVGAAALVTIQQEHFFTEALEQRDDPALWMPHYAIDYLLPALIEHGYGQGEDEFFDWNSGVFRWSVCNTSLLLGMAAGAVVALARRGRQTAQARGNSVNS